VYRTALVIGAFLCLLISSVVFVVPFAANAAVFTRPLVVGSSGADVSALQQLLKGKGYFTGDVTGYFGSLTAKSLASFQTANNIEALGGVGPKTRTLLNSLSGSVSGTASSGSSSNSNQSLIAALLAQVKILQAQIAALIAGNTNPSTAITAGVAAIIQNYVPSGGGGGSTVNSTPSSNGNGGGSNNTPNYGNGPFSSYFTSGIFAIPSGDSPSSASQVTVSQDTTVTVTGANGSDSVKLKRGNSITKNGGGSLDVTAFTTTDIDPASLTLPSGLVAEGAVQFGVPGTALFLSLPTTIGISVSSANNGDTLTVYRAESLTGPWLITGLSSQTCVVTSGLCQVDTTLASHFAATRLQPTVTISAIPSSITPGNSSTVTWSSTNAISCTASGGWSGSQALSGTQTFTNITTSQTYTLTCSGKGRAGSATQSANVTVTPSPADTTAPSAPTSLAGSATSQTQVNLTWTASTDNVGVTGYRVFRNGTQVGTPTVTSYSDTGLSASTAYTYTVKAVDAAGNLSAVSNSVNVTTLAPVPTVTISTNPTSVTSGGSTALTWSSTNASSCTASGAWSGTKATSGNQTFTNLTANQTYTLQCTGTGGSATQSATVTVTAPVDTTPPTVTITGPVSSLPSGTTQATLTATTNENATCRYSTNSAFTFSTGTIFTTTGAMSHSTTLSGLTNGTSYTYYVKCQDIAGNTSGNASVTFSVSTPADTTPPSVTITAPAANLAAGTTQTTLSVTTNENATCAQSTNVNATFAQMTTFTTTGSTAHSTTLSGLQNSTSYTYYVKCQDTAGNISGNASVTFAVATPADTTAPSVPTNVSATAVSSSQINLSWTASTDNVGVTGYQVFRNGTQISSPTTNSYSDTGLTASTQYTYTVKATDAAGNTSANSGNASATTQVSAGGGGTTAQWTPVRIGAGGKITSIDIAPDGTKVIRTDTYGAWIYDTTIPNPGNAGGTGAWRQALTLQSMPAADLTLGGGFGGGVNAEGVMEIVVSPSNSSRMYMMFSGYLYRSDNRGITWTRTAFSRTLSGGNPPGPNGPQNGPGKYIAVDPANSDVIYVSTLFAELRASNDGGSTWSTVAGVSTATNNFGHDIAFDPSSAVVAGKTQGIYVHTDGRGLYYSSNAGASWTHVTGGTNTHTRMKVAPNGTVWLTDSNTGLWKYSGGIAGTWTNWASFPGMLGLQAVAIDPTNSSKVVVADWLGQSNMTTNAGASWFGNTGFGTRVATDIPWLAWTNEGTVFGGAFTTSAYEFDPSVPNTMYVAEGIGVWKANPAYNSSPVAWTSQSAAIEQLVGVRALVPPGGKPNFFFWDRPQFYSNDTNVYPTTHGPNAVHAIVGGWDADWTSSVPTTIAAIMISNLDGADVSGESADGGKTWTAFGTFPDVQAGGSIAASSPSNIIRVAGGDASRPYYSTNGGATWSLATFPAAVPTAGGNGWHNLYGGLANHLVFAADRVTPNKFYAYNTSSNGIGLYVSTNGGANWSAAFSGSITGLGMLADQAGKLKSVPGQAGNLFWNSVVGSGGGAGFVRSSDGGAHWTVVNSGFSLVDAFGFGAIYPGQSYPSILAFGIKNGVYGMWLSSDNAATWTNVTSDFSTGDVVDDIDGDKTTPGVWYVALQGSGALQYHSSGSVTPPSDTTVPSTPTSLVASAISSSAINLSWSASTDNVGVTGYKIFRGGIQIATAATNSYSDTGLTASTAYSYTVSAYDAAGNTSAQSSSASATTQAGAADTTPPVVTISAPTGALTTGTTQTTLSATTNETATCAYSSTAGTAFSSMTPFTTTGGTSHSTTLSSLTNGSSYTTYVKCKDTAGNISTDSTASYSVANAGGGGGGGALDTATTAWVNAVTAAGGSVSPTQQGYVDTLIKCYKSAGVFNTQDREWLLWSENMQQAQIDLIHAASWTAHGTSGFTANAGWAGDGSTRYLDTGFAPASAGGNFGANSANMDGYITSAGGGVEFGVTDGGYSFINAEFMGYDLEGATFPSLSNPSGAVGLWSIFRTDGNNSAAYKNGSSYISSGSDPAIMFPNRPVYIGAQDDSGTADNFTSATLAMMGFGGGLTTAQSAAKAQCDNGYATSKGFNKF
jgi:chitodextrinase